VRRVYIELTQDKAISWTRQKRMYAATPCSLVLSIAASHSAYFARPDELARKILIAGQDLAVAQESQAQAKAPRRAAG
jgi:hypothetical protein